MKDYKVIEVKRSIFEDNDADANKLREELKQEGTFLLNLMSSPGAGKTTTLKRTIAMLKGEMKIGIMEADMILRWMHRQSQKRVSVRSRFTPAACATWMRI